MIELLNHVPIGADQALPCRDIWKRYGIGAETTTSIRLAWLIAEGSINRREEPISKGTMFRWIYWREGEASDARMDARAA